MHKVYHAIQLPLFAPSKICITCHAEKKLWEFPKKSKRRDGCDSQCRACRTDFARKRRQNFSEEKREQWLLQRRSKRKSLTPEQLERRKELHASRILNPVFVEQKQEYDRNWRKENPEKVCEQQRRRVARKRQTAIEEVDYRRILERDGYWCHICEKPVAPQDVSYDHIIPLARNGAHAEENIKISHKICNYRKSDMLLSEMTPYQRRGI